MSYILNVFVITFVGQSSSRIKVSLSPLIRSHTGLSKDQDGVWCRGAFFGLLILIPH